MAKKVTGSVKLQIPAGKATPHPRRHRTRSQGVNIMEFCKAFNARTSGKDQEGLIIPCDHHFLGPFLHLHHEDSAVPILIKRAVGIAKGSAEPHKAKVGKITAEQVEEIAKIKNARPELFRCRSGFVPSREPRAPWASTLSSFRAATVRERYLPECQIAASSFARSRYCRRCFLS